MTDTLVGLGLSNLLLSASVGLLAYAVHRRSCYPALAHLLWALTLIAAISPPLLVWSLPVLPPIGAVGGQATTAGSSALGEAGATTAEWLVSNLTVLLAGVWIIGAVLALAASTRRIVRFGVLLRRSCRPAPPELQRLAAVVAYELEMRTVPSVDLSVARLAPMTWWSGGRVRVVLPDLLRAELDETQLRWILAHELAHIKRHDHLVRWLEWLASIVAWWNPVVWWARRQLRGDEEDACDALVLERLPGDARAYGRTLLAVVEAMATADGPHPELATGLDAVRSLEHRLTRIVSPARSTRAPRALTGVSIAVALLAITVGVGTSRATAPPGGGFEVPSGVGSIAPVADVPPVQRARPARPSASGLAAVAPTATLLRVRGDVSEGGEFLGTAQADTITGTDADERFKGYAGADIIGGGPGRDAIDAGDGADTIRGGAGADTLNGGRGRDAIGGGAGPDIIRGGSGADVIQGGAGRDKISAGPGDDVVRVWADGSPDVVDCGGGDDKAVIGARDKVSRCETVIVRDPG